MRAARVKGLFGPSADFGPGGDESPIAVATEPALLSTGSDPLASAGADDDVWFSSDPIEETDPDFTPAPQPIPGAVPPADAPIVRRDDGTPRYAALRVYATVLIAVGVLPVAASLFVAVLALVNQSEAGFIAALFVWLPSAVAFCLACFVASELLRAVVQIATDVRRGRDAMERIERRS